MSNLETENVTDLNGTGEWSLENLRERYATYRQQLGSTRPFPTAREYRDGERSWIYPVMEQVVLGIEAGDSACIALGVDLIETDALMPFGGRMKANTARALRRAILTEPQKERIRRRIVSMLVAGIIPHEFAEYIKLLKQVEFTTYREQIEAETPRENPYAMRFYRCLMRDSSTAR